MEAVSSSEKIHRRSPISSPQSPHHDKLFVVNYMVALDSSEDCKNAFYTCLSFMNKQQGAIYLIHVADESVKENESEQILERYLHLCKINGVKASALRGTRTNRRESIGSVICNAVQTNSIDFLFLGKHGTNRLKRFIMGSVTKYCSKNAKCNVVVVDKPPRDLEKVMHDQVSSQASPIARENLHAFAPVDPIVGLLNIQILECKGLEYHSLFRKADVFVSVNFGADNKFKTQTKHGTLNPVWESEIFDLLVLKSEKNYTLVFEVLQWSREKKNSKIGEVSLELAPFFGVHLEHDLWLPLAGNGNKGAIRIKLRIKEKLEVEREFWKELASQFDADGNNSISIVEFNSLVLAINPSAKEEDIMDLATVGGLEKGEISFDSLCDLMSTENLDKKPALLKILPENHSDFIWQLSTSSETVSQKVIEGGFYGNIELAKTQPQTQKIYVHDRKSGKLEEEKIPQYIWIALRLMYNHASTRLAVHLKRAQRVLKRLTEQQGKRYSSPDSKKEIQNFIAFHGVDTSEILEPLESFGNFNEFFYRKLKSGARPIAQPDLPEVAVSPADCRLHVFTSVSEATRLWIKGKKFSLKELIQDDSFAAMFEGGSIALCRLAPQDYHRFHSPVDGKLDEVKWIDGSYYTVNPIAVRADNDVFTENKRARVLIRSPQFGNVMYIAVGATMVGSIVFTKKANEDVKKGDELGYFAFGGSTIIVLFQLNIIKFDADLIANSLKPIETLIKMGDSIGSSPILQ